MPFSRLSPPKRSGGGARTDKVRVAFIAGAQNQTEIRVPAVVAVALRVKPSEKKVGFVVDLGTHEHLGLVRIARAAPGQEASRTVNAKATATFTLRTGAVRPQDTQQAMGATSVSYMVENGALTLLLPSPRYDTSPDALGYIRGEHAKSAAEPQAEAHNPAALNVPADL